MTVGGQSLSSGGVPVFGTTKIPREGGKPSPYEL
jgi:hypothetical protein